MKKLLIALLWATLMADTAQAQNNTAYGTGALSSVTTGSDNSAFGWDALNACTTCTASTAIGDNAGLSSTNAYALTALGHVAGEYAGGGANTFVGAYAGEGVSGTPLTGQSNSCGGEAACIFIQGAATGNSAWGYNGLFSLITGSDNNALGVNALGSVTTQNQNVGIGAGAYWFGEGSDNNIVGGNAAQGNWFYTTATAQSASGATTITVASVAGMNVGDTIWTCCSVTGTTIAAIAGDVLTISAALTSTLPSGNTVYDIASPHTGSYIVAEGYDALHNISGATNYDLAVGGFAGQSVTTASGFTAIGGLAGGQITTQNGATFVGFSAGEYVEAADSTAVGFGALTGGNSSPITGADNTAIGYYAMAQAQGTARQNTVVGSTALFGLTSGYQNTVEGYEALQSLTSGYQNVGLGYAIGPTLTAGADNILVGYEVDVPAAATNDYLNIGNVIYCNGLYGGTPYCSIGASNPGTYTLDLGTGTLHVAGQSFLGGGSAAAPGTVIKGTADTAEKGFYDGGANILSFSTNGTAAGLIDASQRWIIGGTTSSGGGQTLQVQNSGFADIRAGSTPPILYGYASNGTIASPTAVSSANNILLIDGYGYDGTQYNKSAQILLAVQGTVSSGIVPGEIFLNTANSSGTLTTGLVQDNAQNLYTGLTHKFADSSGNRYLNSVLTESVTAPTIASGGCTSPAVTNANGSAAFKITIGTSCAGVSTVVLTMPTAPHGWACGASDITSNSTNAVDESANSTTSVTFTSYSRTAGTAVAWNASDVVVGRCTAF